MWSRICDTISAISSLLTFLLVLYIATLGVVPDVVGLKENDAEKLLKDGKFKPEITKEYRPKEETDIVIYQDPPRGIKLALNRKIRLKISSNEEPNGSTQRGMKKESAPDDSLFISYDLISNPYNSVDPDDSMFLRNTKFVSNGENKELYLNGNYQYGKDGDDGYVAIAQLNQFDYGSFTVSLEFKADDFDGDHRTILVGGTSYRWFSIRRNNDGYLELTFNNQQILVKFPEDAQWKLKSGKWYRVICSVNINGENNRILTHLGDPNSKSQSYKSSDLEKRFRI